jgi:hypothetical protein
MFQVYQSSWYWLMFSVFDVSLVFNRLPYNCTANGTAKVSEINVACELLRSTSTDYRRRAIQILHEFRRQVRTKFVLFFLYKIKTNLLYVIQPSKPFLRYHSFMIHLSFHFSANPRIHHAMLLRMQHKTTNIPYIHTTGST